MTRNNEKEKCMPAIHDDDDGLSPEEILAAVASQQQQQNESEETSDGMVFAVEKSGYTREQECTSICDLDNLEKAALAPDPLERGSHFVRHGAFPSGGGNSVASGATQPYRSRQPQIETSLPPLEAILVDASSNEMSRSTDNDDDNDDENDDDTLSADVNIYTAVPIHLKYHSPGTWVRVAMATLCMVTVLAASIAVIVKFRSTSSEEDKKQGSSETGGIQQPPAHPIISEAISDGNGSVVSESGSSIVGELTSTHHLFTFGSVFLREDGDEETMQCDQDGMLEISIECTSTSGPTLRPRSFHEAVQDIEWEEGSAHWRAKIPLNTEGYVAFECLVYRQLIEDNPQPAIRSSGRALARGTVLEVSLASCATSENTQGGGSFGSFVDVCPEIINPSISEPNRCSVADLVQESRLCMQSIVGCPTGVCVPRVTAQDFGKCRTGPGEDLVYSEGATVAEQLRDQFESAILP